MIRDELSTMETKRDIHILKLLVCVIFGYQEVITHDTFGSIGSFLNCTAVWLLMVPSAAS